MRRLLLIFNILFVVSAYAQQEKITFSEAISANLAKYKKEANKAYRTHHIERADFLFDSLVDHCLKNTRLDNFKVKDLNKKEVALEDFKKPVYLITYASWVVPTEGEIPALNKLAEKYHNQVDFVLLFWDNQKTAGSLAEKYNKNIRVLYADELQNNSSHVIRTLKHSLGLPTAFLLDKEKNIIDIRRQVSHAYGLEFEKSFNLNYDSLSKGISLLLIKETSQYTQSGSDIHTTP